MNATLEKQKYMKWLRKFLRNVKNDPFLQKDCDIKNLTVEMKQWERNSNAGLFVIYDRSVDKTKYSSDLCKWEWIRFTNWGRRNMWRLINDVVVEMRSKARIQRKNSEQIAGQSQRNDV